MDTHFTRGTGVVTGAGGGGVEPRGGGWGEVPLRNIAGGEGGRGIYCVMFFKGGEEGDILL